MPSYTSQDAERAKTLAVELVELYAGRRGHYETGAAWAWCVGCGRHSVWPDEGQDTCPACLETIGG